MVYLFVIMAILILYFIPTFTAIIRNHEHKNQIFKTNLFLGWSVLFWFFSLKMAMGKDTLNV
jgi:hypothetical protein